MSYSWDQTRRNLDAAAQAAQQKQQAAAAEAARRLEEVRTQYAMLQERLIQPFIAAMRRAGNPGLARREVPVQSVGKWRKMRCWRAASPGAENVWLDILPDGRWFFYDGGYEAGAGGPGAYWTSSQYRSSEIDPNWTWPIPDGTLQRFQEWIVLLMQRYRVPLPRD